MHVNRTKLERNSSLEYRITRYHIGKQNIQAKEVSRKLEIVFFWESENSECQEKNSQSKDHYQKHT